MRPQLKYRAGMLLTLLVLLGCWLLTSAFPSIDKIATLRSGGHLRIHIFLSLIFLMILSLLLVVAALLMNFRFWSTSRQKQPRLEYGATFLLRYWWCSARSQHWRCRYGGLYRRCSTRGGWWVCGLSATVSSRRCSLVGLLFLVVNLLLVVETAWNCVIAEAASIVCHWCFGNNSIFLMEAVEITSLNILISQK